MFRPLRSGNALVVRYCLRAFSLFVFPLKFLGRLGACLRNLFNNYFFGILTPFLVLSCLKRLGQFHPPPSTISTPPVSKKLASVSAPVFLLGFRFFTSDQPAWSATREPLPEGQSLRYRNLFEKFSLFLEFLLRNRTPPFVFGCFFLFLLRILFGSAFGSAFGSIFAPGFFLKNKNKINSPLLPFRDR